MSKTKIIIFSIIGAVIVFYPAIFGTTDLIPNLQNSVKGTMNQAANIFLIIKWVKPVITIFVIASWLIIFIRGLVRRGRRWLRRLIKLVNPKRKS